MSKITEEFDLKKNENRVSLEVTGIFKKSIEEMNIKIQDLESQVAEQVSQVSKLKAMKYDILYATKEALKKVLKRPHYLKQALENLEDEIRQEFRQVFEELNIKLDY